VVGWEEVVAIPVSYRVDESTGFVLSRASEIVTGRDLTTYLSALLTDPTIPRPLRDLNDLRAVERFDVEPDAIRRLVSIAEAHPEQIRGAKLAVVAVNEIVYGMSRMLELLMDSSPVAEKLRERGAYGEMNVFRDIEEARSWLLSDE